MWGGGSKGTFELFNGLFSKLESEQDRMVQARERAVSSERAGVWCVCEGEGEGEGKPWCSAVGGGGAIKVLSRFSMVN